MTLVWRPCGARQPSTAHESLGELKTLPPRSVSSRPCTSERLRVVETTIQSAGSAEQRGTETMLHFSDAVFAVLITVLVLELRPPEQPT